MADYLPEAVLNMREIGKDRVFIIAEAGVNHNGEPEKAFKLVDIAYEAGADAVKFQTFKPGECTGRFAVKVDYIKNSSKDGETRYDLTKKLALPFEEFIKIQKYAENKGILFLTTPDGYESLEYVNNVLNIPIIKISSTEVTHLKFLEAAAKTSKPIVLSSGLSTLDEAKIAVEAIKKYNKDVTVLHCVSEYPAPEESLNLKAIDTIKKELGVKVGYSDHTLGVEAAVAAVALGACVIEKHFTIDKNLEGPDHKMSLSPQELKSFVLAVRKAELMMGDGIKRPSKGELKNIEGIRRSIVAAKRLQKGSCLKQGDLTFKRPGYGVHPYDYDKVIGRTLNKDLEGDEPLKWEYLA